MTGFHRSQFHAVSTEYELMGTIEGKRSRDEDWEGIGCFIAVKRRGDAMPDREERSRMQFGRPLHW
jgi:hypothetical protein